MVYRRDTYHGPIEKTVAAWVGRVVERISQVNDDGQVEHATALELRSEPADADAQRASENVRDVGAAALHCGAGGEAFTVRAGMGRISPRRF